MDDQETAEEAGATGEDRRGARRKVSDGIREGIGVLSAFKDVLEETIVEARQRRDLSPEWVKWALHSAMSRAQEVAGEARERLDGVCPRGSSTCSRRGLMSSKRV
jgi:hypothetical protein